MILSHDEELCVHSLLCNAVWYVHQKNEQLKMSGIRITANKQ